MRLIKGEKIKHLEIIFQVSERCNISCSYCQVFIMGNTLAADSHPTKSLNNVIALRGFFERSTAENEIEVIQVDFHGGKPLMMKKDRFDQMCHILLQGDYGNSRIELALQTHGILVDEEWITLFEKYKVHASISVDGPKHINNRHRPDRTGESTYNGTINGLRLLQNAWQQGRLPAEPGILSVEIPKRMGQIFITISQTFSNVNASISLSRTIITMISLIARALDDFSMRRLMPGLLMEELNFSSGSLTPTRVRCLISNLAGLAV